MQAPRRLQLRRGNTAAVSSYLGAAGELIVNTDTNTLYIHDGVTVGGHATTVNVALINSQITAVNANITQANVGMRGYVDFSIRSNIANIAAGYTNTNVKSYLGQFDGNIIPSANVTYSLGNITHQWRDLFVSNNTIYVGGVPLSIDNTGNLTINGNVIPTAAYVNTAVANVQVDLTSYALNANVTAANVGLKGYVDQANTIQSQQISSANIGMKGYVDSINTALQATDYQQQQLISNLQISAYSNINVASYMASPVLHTFGDSVIVTGNLTVQGNLFLNGNTTILNTNNLVISDNIIYFANANPANSLDIGISGHFTANGVYQHTGLVRQASSNSWKLFSNIASEPSGTIDFTNAVYDDLQLGNIISPTIDGINANAQAQQTLISSLQSNSSSQQSEIYSLQSNATAQQTTLNTLLANAATQSDLINAINANVTQANIGIIGYVDQGNTIQAAAITQANVGLKGYVDFANTVMKAYVDGQIIAANANVSSSGGTNYSNVNVAAYLSTATINTTGNITAQYISGNISITGNVTGTSPNVTLQAGAYTSVFDNQGNVRLPTAYVTGNVTANYFIGNGALLTGIVAGSNYSNIQVATYLPTYSGNIANLTVTNTLTLTATTIALGSGAGKFGGQGTDSIAIGKSTGQNVQGNNAVALGGYAGQNAQGDDTTAVGSNAGFLTQGLQATAVGSGAGSNSQSFGAVAVGYAAGQTAQGVRAVAIGTVAGNDHQGAQSIAIGHQAGYSYQPDNSIELNASGTAIDYTNLTAGLYITSVKNDNGNIAAALYYNTTTKEITWASPAGAGSTYGDSNVASYLTTYSGNVANLTLGPSGILTFADGTTQITAGGGSYSNVQVATYLPTHTGTVSASSVNTSGNILSSGLSVFGNTRIGLAGAVSGQFHTVVGNITQTSSGGAVYINTTGNVLAAAVVAGAVTSTGTVAVNAATGITTNQATFLLANTNATTINFGGAATTIRMGTNTSNVFVGRAIGNATRELLLRAQGTWNTAINIDSNGGFNSPPYTNQLVIGGSGTGMTANYNATGGYLTSVTIYNPGTGYQNGDVLSVPGGIAGNTFTLTNYSSTLTGNSSAAYTFGIEGNLTVPGNVTARNFIGTIATASQTSITAVGTLDTLNVTGNATVGNLVGVEANTRIISGNYTTTFDIYGNVTMPGNVNVGGLGVTMPARPAFRVNGVSLYDGSQSTANVNLKGVAVSTVYNQGNYFDAATGKFTAPIAGIYEVLLNARVNSGYSGLQQLVVLKNGLNTAGNVIAFWESGGNTSTSAAHWGVSGTVILAVGEYLSANILAGNVTFDNNDNWSVTYLG